MTEPLISRIFSANNPYGRGRVWCLAYEDGTEQYTIDSASGPGRFRLIDEMKIYQDRMTPALYQTYLRRKK